MVHSSGLWQDVTEIPRVLSRTLKEHPGHEDAANLLAEPQIRRVVATGNGASYYVAQALWLASLAGPPGPEVTALPVGVLSAGQFHWREGDALFAVSSSGEFRDLVEVAQAAAVPSVALTAEPGSALAKTADVVASYQTAAQRAVTHSQVFCAAAISALSIWASAVGDRRLASEIASAPDAAATAIGLAEEWLGELESSGVSRPGFVAVFGSGAAWAAAMEVALLLKEVARIPAEGSETREGATSSMYPLGTGDLALSVPTDPYDPRLVEAEEVCSTTGAQVLRLPHVPGSSREMAVVSSFPAAAGLAVYFAHQAGLNPDRPAWTNAYYATARHPRPPTASPTGTLPGVHHQPTREKEIRP